MKLFSIFPFSPACLSWKLSILIFTFGEIGKIEALDKTGVRGMELNVVCELRWKEYLVGVGNAYEGISFEVYGRCLTSAILYVEANRGVS